ncbi:MAG: hypothetical protein WD894_24735 [Pirellulales bacterium]
MPSDQQQLETIRTQTLAQLVELRADPKPTYSIDGQTVSWTAYLRSLEETVEWCNAQLRGLEPTEVESRGCT